MHRRAGRVSAHLAGVVITSTVLAAQATAPADRWTQFRGAPALLGTTQATLPPQLKVLWTYEAGDAIDSSAAIADGVVFVGSANGELHAVNLADGKALKTFAGHADWVYSLAYNDSTKRLATGSFDGEIRIWNVDDAKPVVTFLAAPGYKRPVATAAVKP